MAGLQVGHQVTLCRVVWVHWVAFRGFGRGTCSVPSAASAFPCADLLRKSSPGGAVAYDAQVDPGRVVRAAWDVRRHRDVRVAEVLAVDPAAGADTGCAARGRDSARAGPSDWAPVAVAWDCSPERARPYCSSFLDFIQ